MEFPEEIIGEPLQDEPTGTMGHYEHQKQVGNTNEYLDELLSNARESFKELNLDPVKLPDVDRGFDRKVGKVRFHGGFKATNGLLKGLATLHRAGNSSLDFKDEVIMVKATLAVDNLNVGTSARAWFGKLDIPWHMSANVKYLKATVAMRVPAELKNGDKPRATELTIHEIGKVTVDFKNLGPLNWILNGIGYAFTNTFKNILKNKISVPILKAINRSIDKLPGIEM